LYAQSEDLTTKVHSGKELMAADRFEEAIPIYRDVVQALPNNPGPVMNLGLALHMAGHEREAVSQFQAALKAELNYWFGFTLLSLGEVEAAIPFLEKGVEGDPTVLPAQRDLARAYLRVGQIEKAIPHLKAALPIDEQGSLYYQLTQAYRKGGQRALQREMLGKFQQIQNSATAEKKKFEGQIEITPP
jgi:tetratricopeptide (TPR) repeat protein